MRVIRNVSTLLLVFLCFNVISLSALAAPKTMPDGGIFDAEFYAKNNPDVVAALGSNESTLYEHYLNYGKAEGRLPYATDSAGAATPPAKSAGNCSKQTLMDISGLVYNAASIEAKPNKILAKFEKGSKAERYAAATTVAPALANAKAIYAQAAELCGDYDNLQITKTYLSQMAASIPSSAPEYTDESIAKYYSGIVAYLLCEKPLYEELTNQLGNYK
ncbi:hypothetical protein [Butyrivibrio sp. XBB1001]|uniref:hypothetical protein n=1 Tax=Butyrivibrio sp. XBB1001 TaxID=1280682 RepID=UPI000416A9A2|nr:hypothetical protein [Butyrivibrio sp. XBB1001]